MRAATDKLKDKMASKRYSKTIIVMTTFDKELCQINRKEHSHPAAYTIFHIASGRMYVGSTRDLYVRINKHRTSLENGTHRRKNFQEAYNKNNKLILAFVKAETEEHAKDIEQMMLDSFMTTGKLFNVSPDARIANKGVALSEENKEKVRQKTIEQFATKEARSEHSEITKKMWSDREYRAKHAAGMKNVSKEIIIANVTKAGKTAWENSTSRTKLLEARARRRRPVIHNGIEYPSVTDAASGSGTHISTIVRRLKSGSKFTFYLEKEK